jgi:hypothetical protein
MDVWLMVHGWKIKSGSGFTVHGSTVEKTKEVPGSRFTVQRLKNNR